MKRLVIYHGGCWDGFCAAWVFNARKYPPSEFHAAQYGTEPPDVRGRHVSVLDFSYPRGVMLRMAAEAETLLVLDHHKTAAEDLAGLQDECRRAGDEFTTVVFDAGKSGARLAWEHLRGGQPSPWLVDYIEDRDLWRWALPHSREVNAALRSYPLDFGVWDELSGRDPLSLVPEGVAILRAESQVVAAHVRNAREVEVCGHRVLCVNATTLISEVAGELARYRPFGVCYFERADGKRVYSLRARGSGVDVADVARLFGGGGHPNAAGFELEPGDFDLSGVAERAALPQKHCPYKNHHPTCHCNGMGGDR